MEKNLLRIIRWGTYLILLTPLIVSGAFFFPFVGPKSLYLWGLIEIIGAAYLLLAIQFKKYRPKFNIVFVAILSFLVISIISSVLGVDLFHSFWSKYERMTGLLMWFHLLVFFMATSFTFTRKDWFKVFQFSVITAFMISIIALLPKAGISILEKFGYGTRGGATLGNSSFLATYLLFNVFIGLYLFLTALKERGNKEKGDKWFFFFKLGGSFEILSGMLFTVVALALFLSTGRAAVMAFFAGIALLFFLKLILYEKGALRLAGILLLIVLFVGGFAMIYYAVHPGSTIEKMLAEKFSLVGRDRILVWQIGWEGWKERPLLGWGAENFHLVFNKHFNPVIFLPGYGSDIWYDRAHNIVIDTLATTGVLGLLSYSAIFLSVLYVLWKKYFMDKVEFLAAGIFSVTLFSYFIQNLTVFDMVGSLMMFFLLLGLVGTIANEDRKEVEEKKENASLNFGALLFVLAVFIPAFFYFVVQPARADYYIIKSFKVSDPKERIEVSKKALAISPLGKYQVREHMDRYASQLAQKEIADRVPEEHKRAELDFVAEELEKNIKESPLRYSSYLKLAKIYNIYAHIDPGKLLLAEEVMRKGIEEASPGNQQGYWVLAQTKLFQGSPEEAMIIAEKAISLAPEYQRSHIIALEVAKIIARVTGDTKYIQERYEAALGINPEWKDDLDAVLQR